MKSLIKIVLSAALLCAAHFAVAQTVSKIESVNSGKTLDVTGYSTDEGAPIQQWDFNNTTNQHWVIEEVGDGTKLIRNVGSNLVLDVENSSTDNGAYICQMSENGSASQHWYIEDLGDGTCIITNANSGYVLDVEGISTENGARLHQWEYWAGANQQWRILPIAPPQPPTCSAIGNSGSPAYSTSFVVFALDVQNATRVIFPTWTDANGQDDLVWHEAVKDPNSNRWSYTVRISEHNNEAGLYISHAYAVGLDNQWYFLGGTSMTVIYDRVSINGWNLPGHPVANQAYSLSWAGYRPGVNFVVLFCRPQGTGTWRGCGSGGGSNGYISAGGSYGFQSAGVWEFGVGDNGAVPTSVSATITVQ